MDVFHPENSQRDALLVEGRLERLGGRVFAVGLEHQLGAVGFLGRHHGHEPRFAHRDVLLFHEAKFAGVERQRLVEVGHEHAFQFDSHVGRRLRLGCVAVTVNKHVGFPLDGCDHVTLDGHGGFVVADAPDRFASLRILAPPESSFARLSRDS